MIALNGKSIRHFVSYSILFAITLIFMPELALLVVQQKAAELLLEEGKSYYMEGRFEDAIKKLLMAKKFLIEKDKLIDAYLHLALSHFAIGERDKAKEDLAGLLRLSPTYTLDPLYYPPDFITILDEVKVVILAIIRVDTDPEATQVYLDGEIVGSSPLQLTEIAPGEHKIRVVKQGYKPKDEYLIIKEGEEKAIFIKLEKDEKKPIVVVTPSEEKQEEKKSKGWMWILIGGVVAATAGILLTRGGGKTSNTANTTTTSAPGGNQRPNMQDLQGPNFCIWEDTVEYIGRGNDPDGNRVALNFWIKDTNSGEEWELGWSNFVNNNQWVRISVTWSKDTYDCGSNQCLFRIRAKCKDEQGRESDPKRLDFWVLERGITPPTTTTTTSVTTTSVTTTSTTTTSPTTTTSSTTSSTTTTSIANQPPSSPSISGPKNVKVGKTKEYTFNSTDPQGDNIKYFVYDGEDENAESSYVPSGTSFAKKFTFNTVGTYVIQARACDDKGACSPYSYFTVEVSS